MYLRTHVRACTEQALYFQQLIFISCILGLVSVQMVVLAVLVNLLLTITMTLF